MRGAGSAVGRRVEPRDLQAHDPARSARRGDHDRPTRGAPQLRACRARRRDARLSRPAHDAADAAVRRAPRRRSRHSVRACGFARTRWRRREDPTPCRCGRGSSASASPTPKRSCARCFSLHEGRVAYIYDTIAQLDAPKAAFALGAWMTDPVARLARFQALVDVCSRSYREWRLETLPFSKPLHDLAFCCCACGSTRRACRRRQAHARSGRKCSRGDDSESRLGVVRDRSRGGRSDRRRVDRRDHERQRHVLAR